MTDPSGPPPHIALMQMVQGAMLSKSLQAAAEAGIADLLAEGPRSVPDLAEASGLHAASLYRLLRALASRGIFRETGNGDFENSPLSEPLRRDHPLSVRDYAVFAPHDGNMLAWMRLPQVLKTGEPSFKEATGEDMWEYFARRPEVGTSFDRAMTSLAREANRLVLEAYDFGRFRTLIDVGGGRGYLMAALLQAHPQLRGALLELPGVADAARRTLAEEGLGERCEVFSGDAFESIPSGYEAYVMKNVLHDWPDAKAGRILQRCREAIPPEGRLIVVDAVMVPGNEPHAAKWFDLHMMVALGGKERSEGEFRELLAGAGFELLSTTPLPGLAGIVEAVPK